eukprot:5344485-Pleurochrysis_carterae.AAC.2
MAVLRDYLSSTLHGARNTSTELSPRSSAQDRARSSMPSRREYRLMHVIPPLHHQQAQQASSDAYAVAPAAFVVAETVLINEGKTSAVSTLKAALTLIRRQRSELGAADGALALPRGMP